MFTSLSLRYALPLWIVFLTLCFTVAEVLYTLHTREDSIQKNFQTMVQSDGNRLAAQIERIMRSDALPILQHQEIKRLFSLYMTGSTTKILLLNDKNELIESTSFEHSLNSELSSAVKKVASSGTNEILSKRDEKIIQGLFSVRMPPRPGELRHNGYGTLIISLSYKKALNEEYLNAYQSIFLRLSALLIVIIAIIGFLHKRVITPIGSMSKTIRQIGKGKDDVRMEVSVHDELSQIASSFNQMLDDLKVQKKEIESYQNNLEMQVSEEIAKRLEHEKMMMQQSRLAGMGEMIGNIAHQWRQPLNTLSLILMNMEDAHEHGELDGLKMKDYSEKASALIQKMSTTIDDFRNFFNPDKKSSPFNLLETVHNSVRLMESGFTKNGIHVEVIIDPKFEANGYKNEFSQVILNLLKNARDVLEERHVRHGKIIIYAIKEGDRIILKVQDNGGGIPEAVLPKIFDPYFSTKEEGNGTGIGLYMSKTIIEEHHGGNLSASNGENGAVFTLTIPSV